MVAAVWPLREQALADNDIGTTNLLETGVARQIDNAVSRDDIEVPGISRRRARPFSGMAVFVPRHDRYPASFLAAVQSTLYGPDPAVALPADAPYVDLLVFSRESAESHWQVALATGFQGTIQRDPVRGPGEEVDRPVQPPGWADPASVHAQLASYWQHWRDHGREPPGTSFTPGFWTTQRGAKIAEGARHEIGPVCHCRFDLTYTADPARDGLYLFAFSESSVGACSTVRIQSRYSAASRSQRLVQDPARRNWEVSLPPGSYRTITIDKMRQTCIEIGATPAIGFGVIGGSEAAVAVKGER